MKRLYVTIMIIFAVAFAADVRAENATIFKIGEDITVEEGMRINHVLAINGQITVAGTVEGNVIAIGNSIVLTRKAVVRGNVFTFGGVIVMGKGAEIQGTITEINSSNISDAVTKILSDDWEGWSWLFAILSLTIFFSILIIALLIVVLMPKHIRIIAASIQEETVKITLWGLLGMVLVVPLMVLLMISVIGIVLVPLEMILVVSACLLGFIAISQLIGQSLYALFKRPPQHIIRETFWGLVCLWLIGWIPYIGGIFKVLALMMGMGAVIYTRFGSHAPSKRLPAGTKEPAFKSTP